MADEFDFIEPVSTDDAIDLSAVDSFDFVQPVDTIQDVEEEDGTISQIAQLIAAPFAAGGHAALAGVQGDDAGVAFQRRILEAPDVGDILGLGDPNAAPGAPVKTDTIAEKGTLGRLAQGVDIAFTPFVSAPLAAVKAKILGQDAFEAYENRVLQSTDIDKIIKLETQGKIDKTKTPEQIQLERIANNEITSEEGLGGGKIALLVGADLGEFLVPANLVSKAGSKAVRLLGKSKQAGTVIRKAEDVVARVNKLQQKGGKAIVDSANRIMPFKRKDTVSSLDKFLTTSETVIRRFGKPGNQLADRMRLANAKAEGLTGKMIEAMQQNIKGLSKAERENFVGVLDGTAAPMSQKVASAAKNERGRLSSIFDEAKRVLDPDELPAFRENYFPHMFDHNFLIKNEDSIVRKLVENGQFSDSQTARRFLAETMKNSRSRRFGNLEKSRLSGVDGWEKDPEKALAIYYSKASKRLKEAELYGAKDEIVDKLFSEIFDDVGDSVKGQTNSDFAKKAFQRFTGRADVDIVDKKFANMVSGLQVVSKLGFAQITNAPQGLVNTAFKTNMGTALNSLRKAAFSKKDRAFARKSGALLDSTLDEISEMAAGGNAFQKVTSNFLKWNGFKATETFNRTVAAIGGKARAQWALEQIQKGGRKSKQARRFLDEMGLEDVDGIIQRGALSEDELLQVALRFSNKTQFRASALDLPEYFRSDLGRVVFQFKSFAVNHAKFIKDVLKDDIRSFAKDGDLSVLPKVLTTLGLTQIPGEAVRDIKMLIAGKDPGQRELNMTRFIENFASIGGLGIASDFINSGRFGAKGLMQFALGPTGSDVADIAGESIKKTFDKGAEKGAEEAVIQTVERLPFAGRPLSKELRKGLR